MASRDCRRDRGGRGSAPSWLNAGRNGDAAEPRRYTDHLGVVQGAETVAYTRTWGGASMTGTWIITHGLDGACITDSGD